MGSGSYGDQEGELRSAGELEARANLEEAKQVEAELETAIERVRQKRVEIERYLEEAARDSEPRAPERTGREARIVNGVLTWAYPATGALIKGGSAATAGSWCSGTVVGCRTFLTANHCVHDDRNSESYFVYLQNAGIFEAEAISAEHDDYAFPHADLAVLRLGRQIEGITPIALNAFELATGSSGTIVGFGRSGGVNSDYGLKRAGKVATADCDRPETSLVCWDFNAPVSTPGENSNTCNADSGGPLFVSSSDGNHLMLAGVTSGGTKSSCLTGDHSYDVDVRQFLAWIGDIAGADLGTESCGDLVPVGGPGTTVLGDGGELGLGQRVNYRLTVPPELARLRVAVNAEDQPSTNVDLFVKQGAAAGPGEADCAQDGDGNYAFCEFESPAEGQWFIQVRQGSLDSGSYQLAVT